MSFLFYIVDCDKNRHDLTYSTRFPRILEYANVKSDFPWHASKYLFFGEISKNWWASNDTGWRHVSLTNTAIRDIFQRLNFGHRKWILFGYPDERTFKYQWQREREREREGKSLYTSLSISIPNSEVCLKYMHIYCTWQRERKRDILVDLLTR